jgi:hypothetical protein
MQPRINLGKTAPELYESVIHLDRLAGEHMLTAGIADGQVPDDVYEDAAKVLTDFQIPAVEWLTIATNAWNRIATASRYPVRPS